jgi:putative flippase GtrA
MRSILVKLWSDTFLRYFAASGIALSVDTSSFFALVAGGASPAVAAAVAYCVGIVAHWLITSRAVFVDDLAERGPARTRQKLLFVLTALAGLALTTAIVSIGARLGIGLVLAKSAAVAVSFAVTWLMRRLIVFRPAPLAA